VLKPVAIANNVLRRGVCAGLESVEDIIASNSTDDVKLNFGTD
jgi:hypothetical protein